MELSPKKYDYINESHPKGCLFYTVVFEDENGKEFPPVDVALSKKGQVHCRRYSHLFNHARVYKVILEKDKYRRVIDVPNFKTDYLSNIKE